MIAALLTSLLAAGLPTGAARYRVEIAGQPVGLAELSLDCGAPGAPCTLRFTSRLRLPAASGGAVREGRVAARLDGEGRLKDGAAEVDGRRRRLLSRAVPVSAAELVLLERGGGCVGVVDEESGRTGRACAVSSAGRLRVTVLGIVEEVSPGPDGFPAAVEIPSQSTRFVRDAGAALPDLPPPFEVRVPGPAPGRTPRRFCGLVPDPPARAAPAVPEPEPTGASCREQATAYAAVLERAGVSARIAIGVAQDGEGFVWHAWVEARTRTGWVAIDPAFGQVPARGPRFTVARHVGDPASLERAGERILACWGRAAVE
ncbi:MAG TPA: transglutaminase domain-containing protein [Anaeromyxobacter sp.]|nr:transglutaminase domain-containing protein [Anaeromyxobacter sp.]